MSEEIAGVAFPKPPKRQYKPQEREKKLIGIEMAALAHVSM